MIIGCPKELSKDEKRVALTPLSAKELIKIGFKCQIETKAGLESNYSDQDYKDAGVKVISSKDIWSKSDIIVKVRAPSNLELKLLKPKTTLISFIWPAQNKKLLEDLKIKNVSVISMDMIPRISRAQKMDALSSMANIAGYRAVIEASNNFGRFFTGQITAAGKVAPAKVLVIGAGVAGLAAIGTAPVSYTHLTLPTKRIV